jgi:hypothetical protein
MMAGLSVGVSSSVLLESIVEAIVVLTLIAVVIFLLASIAEWWDK